MNYVCPSCGAEGVLPFYESHDVPVNSCLLLSTKQEALDFPTGSIVLGFCPSCGFITNMAFNPSKVNYSSVYEDQQSFSSTFNAFTKKLVSGLIERYGLHNKSILEIGCGKGDFLSLICELGPNSGVGIDPAYIKGRVKSKASDRLTFIQDFYSKSYANYNGDFICCRHTLEHIYDVYGFVNTIRESIGDCLETGVFFEIPDVARVLKERAFWDIYYEHCSYFSLGSLVRLFRRCNFEVTDLSKAFDYQYLLIEAKPVSRKSSGIHESEDSIKQLSLDVKDFALHCTDTLAKWRKRLSLAHSSGKRVIVWGSGSKCVAFLTTLKVRDEVDYIVDINPYRHGKFIPGAGKEIMPPEFLKKNIPDLVIVMNPIYCREIQQMINDMNIHTEIIAV